MARLLFRDPLTDQFGVPLSNITVEVFNEGTTTPVSGTIFRDRTGVATLPNPFTIQEQGENVFYLEQFIDRVDVRYSAPGFVTETETLDGISPDDIAFHELRHVASGADALETFKEFTEAQLTGLEGVAPNGATAAKSDKTRGPFLMRNAKWKHMDGGVIDLARDWGMLLTEATDNTDALEDLIENQLPAAQAAWGIAGAGTFSKSGFPAIQIPTEAVLLLSRPIELPIANGFSMFSPSKWGARIKYTGTKTRADGAMTAASATLTGSGFVAGDAGTEIAVRGAGVGGSTLVTWIQTFVNAGNVTLAHPAKTTVGPTATYVYQWSVFRLGDEDDIVRGQPYQFTNLVFQTGGVHLSNQAKPIGFEHCSFHQTLGPALTALNKPALPGGAADALLGSVTLYGDDLLFNHCFGSIWHLALTGGLSKLTHSRSNASRDITAVLRSSFHNWQHVDFQGMEETIGNTMPQLWIPSDADVAGKSDLHDLRFGGEIFTEDAVNFEPPFASIVIGPIGSIESSQATATQPRDINLSHCSFGGRADNLPSATSAKNAIVLNKRVDSLVIGNGTNFGGPHLDALIAENWQTALSGTSRDRVLAGNWLDPSNTITTTHTAGIFSHGGIDWRPQPIAQRRAGAEQGRTKQNLVGMSNNFSDAYWTKSAAVDTVALVKNVVGPDGATSGWTFTRDATGASQISRGSLAAADVGQPFVFAVWMKAGGSNPQDRVAALGVRATGTPGATSGQQIADNFRPIFLSDRWERYRVVCPFSPSDATGIEVSIFNGVPGEPTFTSGTIHIAYAQLEIGLEPTAYIDNITTTPNPTLLLPDFAIVKAPPVLTANLPAAAAAEDGRVLIEDAGAGDRNLVIYAGGQRFRIDGGAAF